MNPGRELDALVAEKVMGCKLEAGYCECEIGEHAGRDLDPSHIRSYSTDISAAWEVVDRFHSGKANGNFCHVNVRTPLKHHWPWSCWIAWGTTKVDEAGDSAPHAICLAALKAVGAI